MSKERLLVAKSAEMQIQLAVDLLTKAAANLGSMQLTTPHPALGAARRALAECEKASELASQLVERIPQPEGWR